MKAQGDAPLAIPCLLTVLEPQSRFEDKLLGIRIRGGNSLEVELRGQTTWN